MNKPAAKEPSMDEILSSIRQIIADDDESAAPRRPSLQVAPDPMEAAFAGASMNDDDDDDNDSEPLALSALQIVPETEAAADIGFEALLADAQSHKPEANSAPELVVPDDISFSPPEAAPAVEPVQADEPQAPAVELPDFGSMLAAAKPEAEPFVEPKPEIAPVLSAVRTITDHNDEPATAEVSSFARPSLASASPMPDATLSADLAEGLLETTTKAAIRDSMGKLNAAGIGVIASPGLGNAGVTIESMVRDMLRPMLKEWLDENLPSVVERMVEKEIARVARGD